MARLTRDAMPELYAVLDTNAARAADLSLLDAAAMLRDAGVQMLQYRDKDADAATMLRNAREIGAIFAGTGALLIVNDLPQVAVEAAWDGVHVGQGDAPVEQARRVVGPDRIVGTSTHTLAEVTAGEQTSADYVAVGPVFPTASKLDAEAVVGLEGVRGARALLTKPLVAIGGITAETAGQVRAAGADTVAVIGALLGRGVSVKERVQAMEQAMRRQDR